MRKRILTDAPAPATGSPVTAAVQLRAALPRLEVLSEAERELMGEWLDRLTATA